MKLRRRLVSSLRPLFAHRTRTALALLGVAIGVSAVVISRAIGEGAEAEMARAFERTGTNLLIVKPLPVRRLVARREIGGTATTLVPEDAAAMAALPLVQAVAPAVEGGVRVKAGAVAMKTTVRGTSAGYAAVRGYALATGRMFDVDDERQNLRVAVLGSRVVDALRAGAPAPPAGIRIRGVPFAVIGTLRDRGPTADGADQDNVVLVPLGTALRRVFNVRWLTSVYVAVATPEQMSAAEAQLGRLLQARHGHGGEPLPPDFAIQNTAKTRAVQLELAQALSRYATGLAAIALLVGGVGILALMFLSIRERTGEIGLRMAVGAQPRDILFQFLIEAGTLALAGWAAGVVLGGTAVLVVARATTWPVSMPVNAVLAALAMTLALGLGFGALPARKAALIPPLEALLAK